jgi:ribosomal protein L37E
MIGATVARDERRRWRSATAFDLCELTALWLEREIAEYPGYGEPGAGIGPDPETEALVPTLAAVNRAGFLTIASQPGTPAGPGFDGATWEQRAAVELLVDLDTLLRVGEMAEGTGLLGIAHASLVRRCRRCGDGIIVSRREDEPTCEFGSHLPMGERRLMFRGCRRAWPRVRRLYQVALVDPVWGRNDVLWPWLDRLAEAARR